MRAIVLEAEGIVDSTGKITIKTPLVPPYGILRVCSILARDLDHDVSTSVELGVVSGTREIPIAITTTSLSKATGWYLEWRGFVDQGNGLYATFTGATQGDRVRLIVHGILMPLASC